MPLVVFIDIMFKVDYTLMDLTDWGIWPYILAKLEEPLNFIEKKYLKPSNETSGRILRNVKSQTGP